MLQLTTTASHIFIYDHSIENMKNIHCCCLIVIIICKLGSQSKLCELGYVIEPDYDSQLYPEYKIYNETSYEVKETNNHTILSDDSSNNTHHSAKVSLTVTNNSNCCLNITDIEKEETITRCTKSKLNSEDTQIQLIKHNILAHRSGHRHIDLQVLNGIGKLFSILGSNVKLFVQIVEFKETTPKIEDVWKFQDGGMNKIQVTLPVNNNIRACLNFSQKFNMTDPMIIRRDPIDCQYRAAQSCNEYISEYQPYNQPLFQNNTFLSLNFPSDTIEICNCTCKFWTPNEELLYDYTFIKSKNIKHLVDEKSPKLASVLIPAIVTFAILLILSLLAFCYKHHQCRQGRYIQQETDFEYDVLFLVNASNHEILLDIEEKLINGSMGEMLRTACADRDFEVGHKHFDNLINFLTKSKNIVIFLSEEFLSSHEDVADLKEAIIYQKRSTSKLISILVGKDIGNKFVNHDPAVQNYLTSKEHIGIYEKIIHNFLFYNLLLRYPVSKFLIMYYLFFRIEQQAFLERSYYSTFKLKNEMNEKPAKKYD